MDYGHMDTKTLYPYSAKGLRGNHRCSHKKLQLILGDKNTPQQHTVDKIIIINKLFLM